MLFMYPMWDSESQRLGKQKCTPVGYALHVIAELIGLAGLLLLLVTLGGWAWKAFQGAFHASMLWWVVVPLAVGLLSEVLMALSWRLAVRKQFVYDDRRGEASWMQDGSRITYRYSSESPAE